ncbi:unnamed protein product [Thlaspi arvense]|uniref:Secreted protein n=1 Tax=Thlaspi arvense TaxID=13288 RepID=A0AAU9RGD6_THLAR|nr:unnamed protein product [Thlaspi arvense]
MSVNMTRSAGLLCAAWFFGLILHCSSLNSSDRGWPVARTVVMVGHVGLLSCINGSLLRFGYCICCCFCHTWYCLWFPCCHYGYSKNLAETLPHSHQEGTNEDNRKNEL